MSPTPSGILRSTDTGIDLEITRAIAAPREDVWASLTESDRTALWYGPWERVFDNAIRVQLTFEEGTPWMDMHVEACEPPRRLAVTSDGWDLEAVLAEVGDGTTITFIQHFRDAEGLGDIGPGWEYYLDMLIASRDGLPLPNFDDYYPSQKEYYSSLLPR
ncbi:SRPBCC domain-containing protein [Rhodococcus sovatensis]|uniref:SRPBCC domain-containing protein n=1 Tax=Rhodococcus sovatensis TaxID=1805840 RepID=A0ABZ2PFD8_9NOCA